VSALPLRPWHPAALIATWFGSGLLPKVPGTWGSLAALPFGAALVYFGGPLALLIASLALFLLGVWASHIYAVHVGLNDPSAVVVDEVVAQWLVLLPLCPDPLSYIIALIAFRFFDIAKVWPASWLDRHLKGGLGIMSDDLAAALYAAPLTYILVILLERPFCFP
jgi:phosphatidylglycerophosphatase A